MSTPTFGQFLWDAIEERLLGVWTAFPGKVVSYDASSQTAVVRPGIKLPVRQDPAKSYPEELQIPDLDDVPVLQPWAGKGWRIAAGLEAGDLVICLAMTRSLEDWLAGNGDPVRAKPGRHHDLNDCVCIPFRRAEGTDSSLVLEGHGAKVELKDNGDVILNEGTKGAARKDDATTSSATTDPTFWAWVAAAGTVLAGLGVVAPVPTSLAGKISGGSSTVKVG